MGFDGWLPRSEVHAFRLSAMLSRPGSRGVLKLRSDRALDPPVVDPAYLKEEEDAIQLAEIYEMIQSGYLVQAIDQQPYLQGFETIMWLYLNSQFALSPGGDILTGPGVIDGSNVEAIIELTAQGYR